MFKVEVAESTPIRYRVLGLEGIHPEYMYAQRSQEAADAVLGKSFYEGSRAYNVISNLSRLPVLVEDLGLMAETLTRWLTEIYPAYMAVEGEVGHRVGADGKQRRLLKTSDGREHGTREGAASRQLGLEMLALRPRLSEMAQIALCNASRYRPMAAQGTETSDFSYEYRGVRGLLVEPYADYEYGPERVTKVRDALLAMEHVRRAPLERVA